MSEWKLKTPVAIIIFNRPQTTQRVFEVLRTVKPPKLFVIADGPRNERPGEVEQCAAARAVFAQIDWDCEVQRDYAEANLGCGWRPASGISWVFDQVPEAIILEDDCVPHPSFFHFCEELLTKYRDDERVMHIGGTNFLFDSTRTETSYYFSRFNFCWGWATWRRAWRYFDYDLRAWPEVAKRGVLKDLLTEPSARRFWTELYDEVYTSAKTHIWDYQWMLACWLQGGLSIVPNINLVSNVGFSVDATHTRALDAALAQLLGRFGFSSNTGLGRLLQRGATRLAPNRFANLPVEAMQFPLRHPQFFVRDTKADDFVQRQNYQGGALGSLKRQIKKLLLAKSIEES